MRSPWRSLQRLEPDREYLVLASWIPPRSITSTGRLFRGSQLVRSQLADAEGLVGYSMLARPVRKQYATLSVWVDEGALAAFAGAQPHGRLMADLAPEMGDTRFERWTIRGREGRPSWREALGRLHRP